MKGIMFCMPRSQSHPLFRTAGIRTHDARGAGSAHHEEKRLVDVGQNVDGVGGYRLSSSTPGQSVEPRLADHIQVSTDVHRLVFTAGRETNKM